MNEIYKDKWEESYSRNENHIVYPKEQCVKFLSRFVGKKINDKSIAYKDEAYSGAEALDFGCGIGTQTKLLADFGFVSYGVDISENALHKAIALYPELDGRLSLIKGNGLLPFNDNQFAISMAESVLDSMHFDIAKQSVQELDRVTDGYVFLSLITSELKNNIATEEIVQTEHEQGTVQSYYDINKIEELIEGTGLKIVQQYTIKDYNDLLGVENDVRTYLILSNRN